MNKSALFILKSFSGPFILTFFIAVFVLLMQFVWKYIEDMVGKGLDFMVIAELIFYTSASMVPLALPLAVLLSSLMTFGNLGENYELVAFKSAGISLQRIMKPLIILMFAISIIAFLFSNYILPVANLKMRSLLYDIMQQKPSVNILPGIFYSEIDGFTIKVKDKEKRDDKDFLHDILIYDHSEGMGNRKVIIAESGEMSNSADNTILAITLNNGSAYEDNAEKMKQTTLYRHTTNKFRQKVIRIDMSQFKLNRSDEELFKTHYEMLNMKQLEDAIDTLNSEQGHRSELFSKNLLKSYFFMRPDEASEDSAVKKKAVAERPVIPPGYDAMHIMSTLTEAERTAVFTHAANTCRSMKSRANSGFLESSDRQNNILRHVVQWHKKLTLSYACLMLFLIGAPLGSIIRKGGLGMPVVVSVFFFIIMYVLNITGEKLTKEAIVGPAIGMWLAPAVLTPVGIFITYKATTDSVLFDISSYAHFFGKLFRLKR